MCHAALEPNVASDVARAYLGGDRAVPRLPRGQRAQYGNFSGWDPVAGDFAQSLLKLSRQDHGISDRWVHVNRSTRIMTGDQSGPTLAGMHALGVRNFEVGAALTSPWASPPCPTRTGSPTSAAPACTAG
ncbi:MAG: glycoside hydrolase domain-containing protein [Nocardioidaceae bacterium]